ncbi:hypothetical protein UCRNP2_7265 [Neofusicoccum parvum UCRNP2]|uniref:Secreted protein n=1 Tax=Botryosphaeria parva (strain UCR-NP2) TaxID=1287680 RepID=R1G3P2_BOTPV|nr:hypothetical protein UCRNP2_7265 [Neofusicoccum parvum UCRNP2]
MRFDATLLVLLAAAVSAAPAPAPEAEAEPEANAPDPKGNFYGGRWPGNPGARLFGVPNQWGGPAAFNNRLYGRPLQYDNRFFPNTFDRDPWTPGIQKRSADPEAAPEAEAAAAAPDAQAVPDAKGGPDQKFWGGPGPGFGFGFGLPPQARPLRPVWRNPALYAPRRPFGYDDRWDLDYWDGPYNKRRMSKRGEPDAKAVGAKCPTWPYCGGNRYPAWGLNDYDDDDDLFEKFFDDGWDD